MKILSFLLAILLLIYGCEHSHEHELSHQHTEHQHHPISITRWGDIYELLLEFEPLTADVSADISLHITEIKKNRPVSKAKLMLQFTDQNHRTFDFYGYEAEQPGIFSIQVKGLPAGNYKLTVVIDESAFRETFQIEGIRIYAGHAEIHSEEIEKFADDGITFLKEQQWQTDFQTDTVGFRLIRETLPAVGEVIPHQNGYAEIISPVDGLLTLEHNNKMVLPGTKVKKGQVLLTICPPPGGENSWLDKQLAYQKAKADYKRAHKLLEKDAISQRDFEEIRRNYLVHKAGFESFQGLANVVNVADSLEAETHFVLKSPISGIVASVDAYPGSRVESGQSLIRIIDARRVWLRVDLFEKDYFRFNGLHGLEIQLPSQSGPYRFAAEEWKLINAGNILNSRTRTIPISIEINNQKNLLKVGQNFPVNLITGPTRKVLTVPRSAVIDQDYQKLVFVQKSAELFEKRVVKTGAASEGYIEITNGLERGERIVSRGAYLIKLASTNTSIGHPHNH